MMKILFYGLLLPISRLPFFVLYRISDFLFFWIYYVIGYRKKVVTQNIGNSFPEKSERERKQIRRKFYRHFVDLVVESLKVFTISEKTFIKRVKIEGLEVLENLASKNQKAILACGHFANWEFIGINLQNRIPLDFHVIFAELKHPFFNEVIYKSRTRFNTKLVTRKQLFRTMQTDNPPYLVAFLGDQSPSNANKAYWTTFLNQETPVLFGIESYAKKMNLPIVYAHFQKKKRGYYGVEFELLTDQSSQFEYGEITEMHTRLLEKDILKNPHLWLWTHRRWKLKKE